MKIDNKKSAYSRMYLVTPSVYEKLKKCIDDYDKAELSKINITKDDTDDHSKSNEVIRNISEDEIMANVTPNNQVNNTATSSQSFSHPHTNTFHQSIPISRTSTRIPNPTNKLPGASLKIPDLGTITEEFDESFINDSLDESFRPTLNSTTIQSDTQQPAAQSHTIRSIDESFQPLPGPSRQKESLFAKKKIAKQQAIPNLPVNPPIFENGRYIVHPADADITWINQTDADIQDTDVDMSSTFDQPSFVTNMDMSSISNQPSFASSGRNSVHSSIPNISHRDQSSFRNDTITSRASSKHSRPGFVVKRPLQPKFSVKTRNQKRNICESMLPLKGCKTKVNYVSDANTSVMRDISQPHKFSCHLCEKKYLHKFSLNRHLQKAHKLSPEQLVRLRRPPQLAIEYIQNNQNNQNANLNNQNTNNQPNITKKANSSWVKPGKRTDTQAGFRQRKDDKFKRVMTVGLKRDLKAANLEDSNVKYPGDRTFKNWKI
jgi:hypothetical protein